ncbi:MAG: hypothetical protein NT084_12610 [Bacteroidetes bacterium]|nr:hypothetical protein [Bacteroidota bacterium]
MKISSSPFFAALFLAAFLSLPLKAQVFIDLLNFNAQTFQSTYKDSIQSKNLTTNYNLNVFLPKKIKNGNTFMFRIAGENLHSVYQSSFSNLYSISIPIGFQFVSKNKKWKTLVMGIPKIASDLKDNLSKDVQYGGTVLFTYVQNDSLLKLKFGLYYNRECFGNFFVPLVGLDWKATNRISVYGILPNNMRVEFKVNSKLYFGMGYKNYQRSYRLSRQFNDDFVRIKEGQLKLFVDFYTKMKVVFFTDVAYGIKYSLVQYDYADAKLVHLNNPVYSPMKNGFMFTAGLAYRLRMD